MQQIKQKDIGSRDVPTLARDLRDDLIQHGGTNALGVGILLLSSVPDQGGWLELTADLRSTLTDRLGWGTKSWPRLQKALLTLRALGLVAFDAKSRLLTVLPPESSAAKNVELSPKIVEQPTKNATVSPKIVARPARALQSLSKTREDREKNHPFKTPPPLCRGEGEVVTKYEPLFLYAAEAFGLHLLASQKAAFALKAEAENLSPEAALQRALVFAQHPYLASTTHSLARLFAAEQADAAAAQMDKIARIAMVQLQREYSGRGAVPAAQLAALKEAVCNDVEIVHLREYVARGGGRLKKAIFNQLFEGHYATELAKLTGSDHVQEQLPSAPEPVPVTVLQQPTASEVAAQQEQGPLTPDLATSFAAKYAHVRDYRPSSGAAKVQDSADPKQPATLNVYADLLRCNNRHMLAAEVAKQLRSGQLTAQEEANLRVLSSYVLTLDFPMIRKRLGEWQTERQSPQEDDWRQMMLKMTQRTKRSA